ncbi:MAG TPA: hypothetical protein VLA66_06200, partial [Thermoanaerobaculia bacterium]|nr:hypothetical protein [Thermoanaerobaculia bacterium]
TRQLLAARENTRLDYERYLELGDRASARRDAEEARLWYRRALRMRPGDPLASQRLAAAEQGWGP